MATLDERIKSLQAKKERQDKIAQAKADLEKAKKALAAARNKK